MKTAADNERRRYPLSEYIGFIEKVISDGGEFRIFPRGTSMLPLIREGKDSVVLVKKNIKPGDIVLYRRKNGEFVLHRVVKESGGVYVMCGDNQLTCESGITSDMTIAAVKRIYRSEKEINTDGVLYRAYVFVWKSFFLRRVYFKLRKIFGRSGRR
ncbi:MAG: S24/S26 family peptidase [Oscillospiraceae bacterium]